MIYLIDANVLSEPTKPTPDPRVIQWLNDHEGNFVVDPIVLGEMSIGIRSLRRGRKRSQLEKWFEMVVRKIDCVAWDATVGLRWAELVVDLRRAGNLMPVLDSMIAATALTHGLTVATRNTRDFQRAGVKVIDPFA